MWAGFTAEDPNQRVEVWREQIRAAEIADDALLVLAVCAVAFHQAEIFMLDTFAA